MASVSIDTIIARYQAGFGYVAGNVAEEIANRLWAKAAHLPLYTEQDRQNKGGGEIQLFKLNQASFAEATFKNVKSNNSYAFGAGVSYGVDTASFLAPPLMVSFARDKNVVITPIDRSEVEVIEHFGLKPWSIKLQGILIDMEEHHYPQSMLKKVNTMFGEWGTFKVTGTIFQDLGIHELFFERDFEIGFVEGYADTVKFSVTARHTAPTDALAVGY